MNRSPPSFRPHLISSDDDTQVVMVPQFVLPLVADTCETFFFGLYTALFAFSTFIMLARFKRRKGLSNRTKTAMLAASVVMYAVSAIHWTLVFAIAIRTLKIGEEVMTPSEALAVVYLPTINFILSDGIVLWRAWVLWDRRVVLFILPFLFLVCTLVTTIVSAIYAYDGNITNLVYDTNTSHAFGWTIWGLTLATNLWATSLMFIRAWQHRRFLRSLFDEDNVTSKAEKALAFLVESGAIYLCIWVAYITITACRVDWVVLLDKSIVQLVGIYPTAIVVVITMRLSAADILTRPGHESGPYSIPIVFVPRSPTLQISEAGSNDTENEWKTTTRQDL